METMLSMLIEKLSRAEAFEEAADAALMTAIEVARGAVQSSQFGKSARILRAMIHHRPDDGYRRLVAVDVAADGTRSPAKVGDGAHLPSATAWQWVRGLDAAAAIDVKLGTVTLSSGMQAASAASGGRLGSETGAAKPVTRDATHLFVVPIRAPGRRIDGMLAVEASCSDATGTPFVWEACRDNLALLAGIAAPYLTRLPITQIDHSAPDEFLPVIGQSMQGIVEMLRIFARQEETVLLAGPTGAGKARLARWCHEHSPLKLGPFEVLDLGTVPEDLQLAELFGWKKGAFANAAKDTPGCIARAEKGTLYIDDVEKLSANAQAGLLRVLEERRYRQLGDSDGDRSTAVRFIIGTSADLRKLVDEGKFRADLYHRINVLTVRLPSLRERPDEIVEWAHYMLHRRHLASGATSEAAITQEAAAKLVAHDWPGNLRQLDNIVRRAYALSQIDHGSALGVALRAEHIDRALQYEGRTTPRSLLDHLDGAAEAFVAEAERRTEGGPRLDMDLADSFKGLVIEAAKRRWNAEDKDAVKKAFLLLGKEATVKSRNHWATYEREFDKVQELRRVLNGAGERTKHGDHI